MTKDRPIRCREIGIRIGQLPTGQRNMITDVKGVTVGHETLKDGDTQTGVTAILPHGMALFEQKVTAAVHVINGFGKSAGLMQISEMGAIETPIILTNTFGVGTAINGLLDYMLPDNPEIGRSLSTVNPVVCECNDGFLNDIRSRAITIEHVAKALANAGAEVAEGAVGAGRGMSCYKLKGGIGTASRQFKSEKATGTLGALVLTNMGMMGDLTVDLVPVGKLLCDTTNGNNCPDMGSAIIVLATDIPLSERQLERMAKRATVGLARTGSYIGSGSGEIVVGFTTANPINHKQNDAIKSIVRTHESEMDTLFRATAEAVEEAVLNSMLMAETVEGRDGNMRLSLSRFTNLLAGV